MHGHSFNPNRWWTSSMRSRELILSYALVQYVSIGPVRWPSLPAGNALSHRQMWQMNTQHDPGVFVIWCSLSNGFTADDPGQRRTKCSTLKVKVRFLRGLTRWTLNPQPYRFRSPIFDLIPTVRLTLTPDKSHFFLFLLLFINLTKVVTPHTIGHAPYFLSLRTVQPSIYSAGTV